jgi:hypothetical protein
VDELNQRIDLPALQGYSHAVQQRTRELIHQIDSEKLGETMTAERLRLILLDEGLAHPKAQGLVKNYLGWTKGKCLMNFGLTHGFLHLGEVEVLASLLDVTF